MEVEHLRKIIYIHSNCSLKSKFSMTILWRLCILFDHLSILFFLQSIKQLLTWKQKSNESYTGGNLFTWWMYYMIYVMITNQCIISENKSYEHGLLRVRFMPLGIPYPIHRSRNMSKIAEWIYARQVRLDDQCRFSIHLESGLGKVPYTLFVAKRD